MRYSQTQPCNFLTYKQDALHVLETPATFQYYPYLHFIKSVKSFGSPHIRFLGLRFTRPSEVVSKISQLLLGVLKNGILQFTISSSSFHKISFLIKSYCAGSKPMHTYLNVVSFINYSISALSDFFRP